MIFAYIGKSNACSFCNNVRNLSCSQNWYFYLLQHSHVYPFLQDRLYGICSMHVSNSKELGDEIAFGEGKIFHLFQCLVWISDIQFSYYLRFLKRKAVCLYPGFSQDRVNFLLSGGHCAVFWIQDENSVDSTPMCQLLQSRAAQSPGCFSSWCCPASEDLRVHTREQNRDS